MKPQAVKRIESRLVLEKVAEAENIQISDEKLDEELAKMAEMYKMELDKFKELVGEYEKEQMKKDLKQGREKLRYLFKTAERPYYFSGRGSYRRIGKPDRCTASVPGV